MSGMEERLNKLLAHAGVGSRRHVDELIAAGRVAVDGRRVRELGTKVDPDTARVYVDDVEVKLEKPAYWVVNKPRGYLSTNFDPSGRPRVIDLVPFVEQRVYTVGRLDEASEGLVLLTNDGDLAFRLMHPRFGVEKTYLAQVAGSPTPEDLKKLLAGVHLAEGKVRARRVKRLKPQGESTWLKVVLAEGKNREIRRMLAKLGHKVLRLKRTAIGPVELDRLPVGKARRLKGPEVEALKRACAPRAAKEPAGPKGDRPQARRGHDWPDRPPRRPHGPRHRADGRRRGRRP
jgi:23S rRNA pseudouridine2605 synthase